LQLSSYFCVSFKKSCFGKISACIKAFFLQTFLSRQLNWIHTTDGTNQIYLSEIRKTVWKLSYCSYDLFAVLEVYSNAWQGRCVLLRSDVHCFISHFL
jgi:hypothetical protein